MRFSSLLGGTEPELGDRVGDARDAGATGGAAAEVGLGARELVSAGVAEGSVRAGGAAPGPRLPATVGDGTLPVAPAARGHVRLPLGVRPHVQAAPGPLPGIAVCAAAGPLVRRAGESAPSAFVLSDALRGDLRCEGIFVAPYGGWRSAGPCSYVVGGPPGGTGEARCALHPPARNHAQPHERTTAP
jgi:hypothetical protein